MHLLILFILHQFLQDCVRGVEVNVDIIVCLDHEVRLAAELAGQGQY